jgi:hypothetical protein
MLAAWNLISPLWKYNVLYVIKKGGFEKLQIIILNDENHSKKLFTACLCHRGFVFDWE